MTTQNDALRCDQLFCSEAATMIIMVKHDKTGQPRSYVEFVVVTCCRYHHGRGSVRGGPHLTESSLGGGWLPIGPAPP